MLSGDMERALRSIIRDYRRERIATQILAGMHANQAFGPAQSLTREALAEADRLIAVLDATKPKV